MQFPKKISTSTCGLDVASCEKLVENGEKGISVLNIAGWITDTEIKTTTFGQCTKFTGEFQADNAINGESYRSKTMFVPEVAEMALSPLTEGMKKGEKVKFALQILVSHQKPRNDKGTRFTWGVKNLIEPTQEDELAKFMSSISAGKVLPPPKAEAAKSKK